MAGPADDEFWLTRAPQELIPDGTQGIDVDYSLYGFGLAVGWNGDLFFSTQGGINSQLPCYRINDLHTAAYKLIQVVNGDPVFGGSGP